MQKFYFGWEISIEENLQDLLAGIAIEANYTARNVFAKTVVKQ